MTTLNATWEPGSGAVLLEVAPTSTVTAILRTDANGSAVPVRTQEDALPTASPLVVRDFEAADGPVTYRVLDAGTGATDTVTVALTGIRLAAVVLPQALATPSILTGYEATRAPSTTVHEVVGRADPVPSLGPLRARTGTLDIWCEDYATARAVEAVYEVAEVVMMRQPFHPGLDLYHVASGPISTRVVVSDRDADRWSVSVPYAEVRRPLDALRGSVGWTFDALATAHPTFDSVLAEYATFADLTVGPPA